MTSLVGMRKKGVRTQDDRHLAVSGGVVTGQVVPGSERGEVLEDSLRVRGAVRNVQVGVSCKVVLKIKLWASSLLRLSFRCRVPFYS
jgi:hypothetical protein